MSRTDLQNLVTWWEAEADGVRVECFHCRGGFRVATLRAGQESAARDAETEREARAAFEDVVEELVDKMREAV